MWNTRLHCTVEIGEFMGRDDRIDRRDWRRWIEAVPTLCSSYKGSKRINKKEPVQCGTRD